MHKWDDLSMTDRADIMQLFVQKGIYNLDTIRKEYNKLAEGGDTQTPEWTMQDEAQYQEWRNSLPDNLKFTDDNIYDMRGAFRAGMQPTLEADGFYHLQSRDPETGRILKSPLHPTYLQAIIEDARMGYYPKVIDGKTYTQTWEGNQFRNGGGIHIKPSHRGRLTELKARTGKSEAELYNDGNPSHKKMVVFARNARKWKHEDGGFLETAEESTERNLLAHGGPAGNYYDGWGDAWNFLKSGIQKARQKVKDWGLDKSPSQHLIELFTSDGAEQPKNFKSLDGSVWSSREEALAHNSDLVKEGRFYAQKASGIRGVKQKTVPRKPNTSSTAEKSMELENKMYTGIDGYRERVGYRTKEYDIPYGDSEIKVQPKGSTIPINISVNALDSVAKYAGVTGTPIETALGLPMQETGFGRRPLYNYGKLGEGYSNRDLGNANYFKNFGSIPAEYLVRDFRYNGDIVIKGNRENPIDLSIPPLQHALEFFNEGKYNPGDPNHTHDVTTAGNNLWDETTGSLQDWWQTEGKEWYNKGTKQRKK